MTRGARALAALPAAALALAVLGGCGQQSGTARQPGAARPAASSAGATSPAPSASELAHMRELVDEADSAVAAAESDAAGDK